jgi:hypothetical protein
VVQDIALSSNANMEKKRKKEKFFLLGINIWVNTGLVVHGCNSSTE